MNNEQTIVLTTTDRSILLYLYEQENHSTSTYNLHETFSYSPSQLSTFISKMSLIDVIHNDDEILTLTEYGANWILAYRNEIFLTGTTYEWSLIPPKILKKKIDIGTLYAPDETELGKHFFFDLKQ